MEKVNFRDPATNTAWVNMDLNSAGDTTAAAADGIHEGIGHRAGLPHSDDGVMTERVPDVSDDNSTHFSTEGEIDAVIDYLSSDDKIQ